MNTIPKVFIDDFEYKGLIGAAERESDLCITLEGNKGSRGFTLNKDNSGIFKETMEKQAGRTITIPCFAEPEYFHLAANAFQEWFPVFEVMHLNFKQVNIPIDFSI